MIRKGLVVLLTLGLAAATGQAQTDTVDVGNKKLTVPAPPGLVDVSGRGHLFEQLLSGSLPPNALVLRIYLSQRDAGSDELHDQIAVLGVETELQHVRASQREFDKLREQLRSDCQRVLQQGLERSHEARRSAEDMMTQRTGMSAKMEMQQPTQTGIFVDNENMIGMRSLLPVNLSLGHESNTSMMIMCCTAIRVSDRVVFAYTYDDYESQADVNALEELSQQWAAQIVEMNPNSMFGGVGKSAAVGAIAAVIAGVVAARRRKKNAQPPPADVFPQQ